MRVRVLGPVAVVLADGAEISVPAGKPLGVLAMLTLAGGRPVAVDHLVTGLWGDAPSTAAKTLQVHVSTLRSKLRPVEIEIRLASSGYYLDLGDNDADCIDVTRFARLTDDGLAALVAGRHDDASRLLQAALEVWEGEPLSNVLDSPFAAHEVDRLNLRRLAAQQGRIEADLALGLGTTLVDETRQVAEASPYDERACQHHMIALYRAGQSAGSLAAYRRLRIAVGDDLGLEPSPELVDLERQILLHDDRLLARGSAELTPIHQLPAEVSSFVGRGADLDAISEAVSEVRCVTLTGAGGTGKTRLAIAVAHRLLEQFADGVRLVELAPLAGGDLVTGAFAEAIGSRVDDGVEGVVVAVGSRKMLVVVDNCEHVVDEVATLAATMLRRCAGLRLLATSREALAIDGEHIYRVPPLGLPGSEPATAATVLASDAVRLFEQRASAQQMGFAVDDANAGSVAEICLRLDGLPLAIELAAARLRTMPLHELADHLEQRFRVLTASSRRALGRQQTLRALIDWSYDLLSGEQQCLFDQLSVFAGGFTVNAVESIVVSLERSDRVALLLDLVDKSLVEPGIGTPVRYRQLESIRQYAAERLESRVEVVNVPLRLAHALHYLGLAEAAAPALENGVGQRSWLERLDAERDNLRTALATLTGDPAHRDEGLRMARALAQYWDSRSLFIEGAATTLGLLAQSEESSTTAAQVLARCTAAELLERTGDLERAAELAGRAVEDADALGAADLRVEAMLTNAFIETCRGRLAQALGQLAELDSEELSDHHTTRIHMYRAFACQATDDLSGARVALEHALASAIAAGNERRQAHILSNMAILAVSDDDLTDAQQCLDRAQALATRLRDGTILAHIEVNRGLVALQQGDHTRAWLAYREALFHYEFGGRPGLYPILLGFAVCCRAAGLLEDAAVLHGAIEAGELDDVTMFDPVERTLRTDDRKALRQALGDARFDELLSRGRMLRSTDALEHARSLRPAALPHTS